MTERVTPDEAREAAQCCTEDDAGDESRRKLLAFIDQAERDAVTLDAARTELMEQVDYRLLVTQGLERERAVIAERDALRAERSKVVAYLRAQEPNGYVHTLADEIEQGKHL